MAGEDIIPSLGLDTGGFDAGLAAANAKVGKFSGDMVASVGRADGAIVKLGESSKTLAQPIKAAADSTAHLRAESEKLEKVASLLGPKVGGVVSMMSKLGKTAGSAVGGATLAIAGIAAAAGAALYAMGAFASGVLDTIENVDDLAASLDTVTRDRLSEQIKSLRESKTAMDEFGESWTEMKIAVSGAVDGPLADLATILGKSVEGWALMGEAVDRFVTDHPIAAKIIGFNNPLSDMADLLKQVETNANAAGDALNREIDAAAEAAAKDEQARRDARDRAASHQSAAPAPKHQGAANRGPSMAGFGGGVTASTEAELDALAASMIEFADTTDQTMTGIQSTLGAGFHVTFDAAKGDWKDLNDAAAAGLDHEVQLTEEAEAKKRAARQQSTADAIDMAGAMSNVLGSLATGLTDLQVENTEEGTAAHRKALREQFVAQKAAALASIAINTAVGFTQDLAKGGAVGIILGAATLLAGGVQAGLVIGTQAPKFHTGGLAPDERYGMPQPITRNNERTAVLTQEGQRRIGELDRINAGAMGGGQILQVVVRDDGGRRMSGRQFARPDPGVGFATRAVRS